MAQVTVSVVVAVWRDAAGVRACFDAWAGLRDEAVEVLAVGTMAEPADVARDYPWVRWVEAPGREMMTPHLWGLGMKEARGEWVAITTSHFVPAGNWLAALRERVGRAEVAGIGGRIHPPGRRDPVIWATYFQRYSAYLHLADEQVVRDIAGDNAAYRRAELERFPEFAERGFWEPDFHKAVMTAGGKLLYVPGMAVMMVRSFGFWPFVGQRYHHAIQFGQARVRGTGWGVRLLRAAALPLIPLVLLAKIAGRVFAHGQLVGRFLLALPVLTCFVSAWALGEVVGYLTAGELSHGRDARGTLGQTT